MTAFLHVISNTLGSDNRIVIYETNCGEVVYDGHYRPTALELFDILKWVNGGYDDVKFHELTDEQMENWQENY